jgi:hypothetical protein
MSMRRRTVTHSRRIAKGCGCTGEDVGIRHRLSCHTMNIVPTRRVIVSMWMWLIRVMYW